MRDREFYERLLGLKEPWKVKAVKMDVEGRRVEDGWERRSWRHLDTWPCELLSISWDQAHRLMERAVGILVLQRP